MKKLLLIPALLLFAACGNENTAEETTETTGETVQEKQITVDEACYLYTENTVDTQLIHLKFDGDSVTGEMKYLPWQKDATVGTVTGKRAGNTINLEWFYWQEGMEIKEPRLLVLEDDKLMEKYHSMNEQGEIYVPDNAKTMYIDNKVDCSVLPERDY